VKEQAVEKKTPSGFFGYGESPRGGEGWEHRWDVREIVHHRDGNSGTRSLKRGQE